MSLGGTSNLAILAGSAANNTGATNISGDLTFDAKGNANAVFIIQIASALTTTSGRNIAFFN